MSISAKSSSGVAGDDRRTACLEGSAAKGGIACCRRTSLRHRHREECSAHALQAARGVGTRNREPKMPLL